MARTLRAAKTEEERILRRRRVLRKAHLKKMYGITLEDYDKMLVAQNGQCAICGTREPGGKHQNKTFMVDHDHKTGKVRGLLCNRCNMVVGLLDDRLSLSIFVSEYLCQHTTTAP